MASIALSLFRPIGAATRTADEPPRPRRAPVFIGDAVQPWGGETLLLAILRAQSADRDKDLSGKG